MNKSNKGRRKSVAGVLKEALVVYHAGAPDPIYPLRTREDKGWEEFREQCRRQMKRPLALRIKYGFSRPIGSTLDSSGGRAFKTMAEYRAWCEKNMPGYLGFKRPGK